MNILKSLPTDDSALIPRTEMRSYIGLTTQTLARRNSEGLPPVPTKLGHRVYYLVRDVRDWIAERRKDGYRQNAVDKWLEASETHPIKEGQRR